MSCGCGEYEEDHGDSDNITTADLRAAAEAADITPAQAAKNIQEAASAIFKSQSGGPTLIRKSFVPVEVKVLSEAEGLVRATVSVVGNVDRAKDRIMPGAFGKAFEVANDRGVLPTVVYGHQWDDINQVLGSVKAWEELAPGSAGLPPQLQSKGFGGLNVDVQFNLEVPAGQIAFSHLSGKHLSQWSFAFETDDEGWAEKGVREIKSIREIHEVSLVLVGMNQDTVTSQIKAFSPATATGYVAAVKSLGQLTPAARLHMAETVAANVKAKWTQAQINDLPDSAFALVLPGGKKDSEGKTVPRDLRLLPHHGADGKVDLPHLRNALARLDQSDMTDAQKSKAQAHLNKHAKAEGVGDDSGKAMEPGETKAHGAFSGSHSHSHKAMGDQGGDDMHNHEHSHDGDADHGHAHEKGAATGETKDGGLPELVGDEAMHNQPLQDAEAAIKLLLHQEIEEGEAAGVLPLAFIWCDLQRWAQQEAGEYDSYYRFSAALDDLNARRKNYEAAVAEPAAQTVVEPPPPMDAPEDRPSFQFLREVFASGSEPTDAQIEEAYQRTLQAMTPAEQPPETQQEPGGEPHSTENPADNIVELGLNPKVIRLAAAMAAAAARN